MKKKFFALLMVMALVLGMSSTALAAIVGSDWLEDPFYNSPFYDNTPEVEGADFVWTGIAYAFDDEADKSTCSVVGLCAENSWTRINIPANVNGITVTAIVDAFKENNVVNYVSIPETVKMIDAYSFNKCANLTTINYCGVEYTEVDAFVSAYLGNGGSFGSADPARYEFGGTALAGSKTPVVDSPTGDNTPIEVAQVEVKWSETKPWTVEASNVVVGDDNWDYDYRIIKDGKEVFYGVMGVRKGDAISIDISYTVGSYGEGKYTVKVLPNYYDQDNGRWVYPCEATTSANTYTKPAKQLATPANLAFDKETSKLTFDAVEGAVTYDIYTCVYVAGVDDGKSWSTSVDAAEISANKAEVVLDDYIVENLNRMEVDESYKEIDFTYSIEVIAVSDDINTAAYSDYAKLVLFENKVTKEQVKENFDEAFAGEEIDVDVAVDALVGVSNDTIVELMETDAAFAEKVEKLDAVFIEDLGDSYKGATSKTEAVDASKVEVVGVAINGAYVGAQSVELTFAEPEEEVSVPEKYENGVQLDISLLIDDYAVENLAVPVTITMPIPTGVAKENLVILHYHGDATEPEVLVPTVNADGTMTFIVDGFSTFVVANQVVEGTVTPETPKTGDASTTAVVWSLLFLAAGVVLVSKRNSFAK